MSCKLIRFTGATSTNEVGAPAYGISGVRVNRDSTGALLDSPVVYWSDGAITNLAYDAVTALADIADYTAAKVAEQTDCTPEPPEQIFAGEDTDGRELLLTVVGGVPTSAIYLDGTAYTGDLGDINFDDEDDKELIKTDVCFNGKNIAVLHEFGNSAQALQADNGGLFIDATNWIDVFGTVLSGADIPAQANFDDGTATVGACRVSSLPPAFNLCGSGC